MNLIDKDAIVAEIEKQIELGKFKCQQSQENNDRESYVAWSEHIATCGKILSFINTIEVKDPYKECIQYDSIKAGIQANAETYSFNIESKLFNQLTKGQQGLWRKEIEQAYISGGEMGVELARDTRYKENRAVKEVDLEKEIKDYLHKQPIVTRSNGTDFQLVPSPMETAKHFFELGLKAQKMTKDDNIIVPRWFLENVENTLRIQNNIIHDKKSKETCQDRNIRESLNEVRKLLNGEELTGMERTEK